VADVGGVLVAVVAPAIAVEELHDVVVQEVVPAEKALATIVIKGAPMMLAEEMLVAIVAEVVAVEGVCDMIVTEIVAGARRGRRGGRRRWGGSHRGRRRPSTRRLSRPSRPSQ